MTAVSKHNRRMTVLAAIIAISLTLVGCRSEPRPADVNQSLQPYDQGQSAEQTTPPADVVDDDNVVLIALCGSSFVNPTNKLIEEFSADTGITISSTVAGSEDFLPQVKVAALGDILITHDPFLDLVNQAGKLADSVHVGFVAPVLAVQPGNPRGIKTIEDLAKPGLKVGLTNPDYSTAGEMVFALLEKKGIKDQVLANVGNRLTKGHTDLANLLKTETVDAGIIWNGVAHTFKDSVEMVPTPYEYDEEIRVHVMSLNYSKHPEEVARFMAFIKEKGPDVFAEYGYVK